MSANESETSLDEVEASLPVEERLRIRGRTPEPEFDDAELLYHRVKRLAQDGVHPLPKDIGYPGSDGMSVNRGRFSKPEDVLWPHHSTWNAVEVSCGEVRGVEEVSGDDRTFGLDAKHSPVQADQTRDEPENYAHSLVITLQGDSFQHEPPTDSVRRRVRNRLAALLRSCGI